MKMATLESKVLGTCVHCQHDVRVDELTCDTFLVFERTGLGPECQEVLSK